MSVKASRHESSVFLWYNHVMFHVKHYTSCNCNKTGRVSAFLIIFSILLPCIYFAFFIHYLLVTSLCFYTPSFCVDLVLYHLPIVTPAFLHRLPVAASAICIDLFCCIIYRYSYYPQTRSFISHAFKFLESRSRPADIKFSRFDFHCFLILILISFDHILWKSFYCVKVKYLVHGYIEAFTMNTCRFSLQTKLQFHCKATLQNHSICFT
jgi:hypothetical protein